MGVESRRSARIPAERETTRVREGGGPRGAVRGQSPTPVERGGLTITSRQAREGDRLRMKLEYQDRGGDVSEWPQRAAVDFALTWLDRPAR
jgi:hypothetical protein